MEIRLKIINPDGTPVADAKVEARGRGGTFVDSYSDEAGVVQFSYSREEYGDSCKISVSKSGFQDTEKVHHIHSESQREFAITLLPKNGARPPIQPTPIVPPEPPRVPHPPGKRIPWIIIVAGAACALAALAGVAGWLFVLWTRVQVPRLIGKDLEEAVQLLTTSQLVADHADQTVEIVSPDQPPSQVISQNPPPDQLVARGSHVKLTVGSPKAKVPALVEMDFDQAVQVLTSEYLVGEKAGTVSSDKPANQVVSQDPRPGQLVDPDSTVNLIVSTTPSLESYPGEEFPQTRLSVLTKADIAKWNYPQLRYAINEMYARHGATFPKEPDIENQFRKFQWYHPLAGRTFDQIEASFSQVETQNLKFLAENVSGIIGTAIAGSELQLQIVYDHLRRRLTGIQKQELLREKETQWIKWKDSLPPNSERKLEAIQNRIRLLQTGKWE
jgi:hypothetical protein